MDKPANSSQLLKDEHLKEIIYSDVGVESLLNRLKQSIHSCKEFANFLKKVATMEAEHSQHLKKTSRAMVDSFKRPEIPTGTFQSQILEIVRATDRLGDAGNGYIDSMHRIHDEISTFVKDIDRQRKLEKETALRNEKNLLDAEQLAEKAKARYESVAEELDRVRTGDPSKKLALRQKSEEELQKKFTVAEMDYQQKVDQAQRLRRDTANRHRVDSVEKIKNMILECDEVLAVQVLQYANLTEVLQLNRGFVVAPIKPPNSPHATQGVKEMAARIDPQLDLYKYILNIPKVKKTLNRVPVSFTRHSVLGEPRKPSITSHSSGHNNTSMNAPAVPNPPTIQSTTPSIPTPGTVVGSGTAKTGPMITKSPTVGGGTAKTGPVIGGTAKTGPIIGSAKTGPVISPPTVVAMPTAQSEEPAAPPVYEPPKTSTQELPTFGTPLETLLLSENQTVPRVVYQCVQAIDNFGLEVEDIYKKQGSAAQVEEIKVLFNADAASVDLMRPSSTVNDIHSVASALKLYFQELPEPLLTREYNTEFLSAVNVPDADNRRDIIHGIVNKLPDPNYTTLRYLVFHLYRVQELQNVNHMGFSELGVVWGPVLMGTDYSKLGEMPAQSQIVEIIVSNAYAIFEAE